MKVLQVSSTDLIGSRFNGRDLNRKLKSNGHEASHCVWSKKSKDSDTWILGGLFVYGRSFIIRRIINRLFSFVEKLLSIQSVLYPWGGQLFIDKRFKNADIVHYHLLHNGYFSLLMLPKLSLLKPSIWTIHDPWAMTGHCVYPQDCERWMLGCGECPDTKKFIPMLFDNTALMFRIKNIIYKKLNVELVFASDFMLNMAKKSPLFKGMKMHHIPFGVNQSVFKRTDKKANRSSLGIKEGNYVISFRSINYEYKGLEYIRSALRSLTPDVVSKGITILTVNDNGLLKDIPDCYQVIELGSVSDEQTLASFYNCSDLFLMPSTGEAFGMMAIEAMSCGVPVVVFEGTSLPDVVFAPRGGVSVPMHDSEALSAAIERLLLNPEERRAIGNSAYDLSREHYDFNKHYSKIIQLYKDVITKGNTVEFS